jgi:lipopolysaccharide biosynthesis glycosyltransferase
MTGWSIWIGYDTREAEAFSVARESIRAHLNLPLPVHAIVLDELRSRGLYQRPTEIRDGRLWDAISEAPMSTEFAISRFLVPALARRGLALFMDCDMLIRANLGRLFEFCNRDPSKAVWCVKHDHRPCSTVKMDNQAQTQYARKNWSSVMVFNVGHPSNARLTPAMVNALPGRDLHAFCWLGDHEIGELDPEWNFLVGHTDPNIDPKIVHFTEGGPWMRGYENVPFADEWRAQLWKELRTA